MLEEGVSTGLRKRRFPAGVTRVEEGFVRRGDRAENEGSSDGGGRGRRTTDWSGQDGEGSKGPHDSWTFLEVQVPVLNDRTRDRAERTRDDVSVVRDVFCEGFAEGHVIGPFVGIGDARL